MALLFFVTPVWSNDAIPVVVARVSEAPTIDGNLVDWQGAWKKISVTPAIKNDNKNTIGKSEVELQVVTSDERLFIAARWADKKADTKFKPWVWRGNRYRRDKDQDDKFALRFDMGGTYDDCMLSKKTYSVDVWLWSAARTNGQGLAEDMNQHISTQILENAAEYEHDDGTIIYIKKRKDTGTPIYRNNRLKKKQNQGASVPSVLPVESPSGSIADVKAKGIWKDGFWHLEMSRKLNTGHDDDRRLKLGEQVQAAIAIFNRAGSEHKSNSPTLVFYFEL